MTKLRVNLPQPVLQPHLPERLHSGSWLTGDSQGYHVQDAEKACYASTPCDRSSWAVQTWSAGTMVQKCLPADPFPGTEHFAVHFGSRPGGRQA